MAFGWRLELVVEGIRQFARLSTSRVEWGVQRVQGVLECLLASACPSTQPPPSFSEESTASDPVRFPYWELLHAHILELLHIHTGSRKADVKGGGGQ